MLVQVHTDNNVETREGFAAQVESRVHEALSRFGDRITRVRVHFGDENSDKKAGPDDKRCAIEVRLAGLEPLGVRDHAPKLELALEGAVDRAVRVVEKTIERKRER